jgi:hypothetical protein
MLKILAITTILLSTVFFVADLRAAEPAKEKSKRDYEKLVADLVNRNPEPTNADIDHDRATFAKDYDWNELNRIDKSLQILIDNFDEAWPTLVKHQKDKEYCLTAHHCTSTNYDSNYSVGGVCSILLRKSCRSLHSFDS